MQFVNLFHIYGLIIGLAVAMGWWIVEKQATEDGLSSAKIFRVIGWVIIFGLVGARFWHVMTDWPLYIGAQSSSGWWHIFYLWQGGLSILGAMLGGLVGLRLAVGSGEPFFKWLDWVVLALPFAQALGRLANYFNQELYGLPSTLPWAITIDTEHRLPGFEQVATYHPLFLYEAILLLLFGVLLWSWKNGWFEKGGWFESWLKKRARFVNSSLSGQSWLGFLETKPKPGTYFFVYLVYYSFIRFNLDFLRLGTPHVLWGLGINQILMAVVFLSILGWWFGWRLAKILLAAWILLILWFGIGNFDSNKISISSITNHYSAIGHHSVASRSLADNRASIRDHSLQSLEVGKSQLVVEVVNSLPSIVRGLSGRSEIGADGMLFLMPKREKTQFWMPDMEFDIDIIWIDQGKIVGITSDIPHPSPGTTREELELYPSPDKVEWVLEVAAGEAKKNGWQVNDMIKL